MKSWNELSMAEKADVMKLAIEGGVYDLDSIRSGYNEFAKGGKIHIDPSKKGTFTAAASKHGMGVQQFASKVLAHPENYSPAMRKKANFARNASKWKHEEGGNLYSGTNPNSQQMSVTYGRPYYSYDENGVKIDDTLNYNATFPEVIITPDSRKSPAERAILERERRRNNDAYYGNGTYNAKADREQTELEKIASQKAWETSTEKQALDYAQAAATGIGIGADMVSGLPVYSSLKGARVLSEAKAPLDYIEGGLWLAPIGGTAYQAAKPVVKKGANLVTSWTNRMTPEITLENAARITPEQWDAAYIKALDMGDKIEAQRLRDLHFKAKAPNTKITTTDGSPAHIYHGTDADWVKYDASKFGSATDDGYYGIGLYGTEYRPLAKGYGDNVLDLYINAERPYTAGTQDIFGNPYTLDEAVDRASVIRYFNRDREGVVFGNVGNYANTDFPKLLKEIDNADAAVYGIPNQRFNEVVIPRGEQMKLADAVTYDDAGTIIPLSKRDNFNINDIRYGFIPTAISTLGLSTYLNNKNK